jgi:hypothetical protein
MPFSFKAIWTPRIVCGSICEFYNQRFNMNLSDADKQALVAFLRTL